MRQLPEGRWDFTPQVVGICPELFHGRQLPQRRGHVARERVVRNRKGLQCRQVANKVGDTARNVWIGIHPQFHDGFHTLQEGQIALQEAIGTEKVFQRGESAEDARYCRVELIAVHVDKIEQVKILKIGIFQSAGKLRVSNVKIHQIVGNARNVATKFSALRDERGCVSTRNR